MLPLYYKHYQNYFIFSNTLSDIVLIGQIEHQVLGLNSHANTIPIAVVENIIEYILNERCTAQSGIPLIWTNWIISHGNLNAIIKRIFSTGSILPKKTIRVDIKSIKKLKLKYTSINHFTFPLISQLGAALSVMLLPLNNTVKRLARGQ